MNEIERKNVERNLRARGRIVTNWWDNLPVHRPMTPYEKFAEQQRRMGEDVIDEETFNLGIALLGNRGGIQTIFTKKKS
jgi:hypothetical protein